MINMLIYIYLMICMYLSVFELLVIIYILHGNLTVGKEYIALYLTSQEELV